MLGHRILDIFTKTTKGFTLFEASEEDQTGFKPDSKSFNFSMNEGKS